MTPTAAKMPIMAIVTNNSTREKPNADIVTNSIGKPVENTRFIKKTSLFNVKHKSESASFIALPRAMGHGPVRNKRATNSGQIRLKFGSEVFADR